MSFAGAFWNNSNEDADTTTVSRDDGHAIGTICSLTSFLSSLPLQRYRFSAISFLLYFKMHYK